MDVQKIVADVDKLVADFEVVVADCKTLAEDLMASGVDAQAFFAGYVDPKRVAAVEVGSEIRSAPNWGKLLELLVKYGPAVYAMLAKIFNWPPIPFPVPTEG